MNIGAAIKKPFSNITALIKGIVLGIIPIVNVLTVPGFAVRVANKTMQKDHSMPAWNNFGELIVDSIKYIVISIVYMIPAMIVFGIALASMVAQVLPAIMTNDPTAVQTAVMTAIMGGAALAILGVILAILGIIMVLSGVLNFAKTKQFGAAFRIGEVLKNFFRLKFIAGIIVTIIVAIILSLIMAALALIPIIGFVIPFILSFPFSIIYISILADSYA